MSLLEIVLYPDPVLKKVASPVEEVTEDIKQLLEDMAETMYDAPGIGLAAPQIGKSIRAMVVDVGIDEETGERTLYKLVNPEIVDSSGKASGEEGCLSIPDIREVVDRSEKVTVEALDENGQPVRVEADGLLSICLQHEIDHLDGVLFIDKLSRLKKEVMRGKLKKLVKAAR